jgi:hypothetical protein
MSELDTEFTQAHRNSTGMRRGIGAIVAIISGIIVSTVCIAICTVIAVEYTLFVFFQNIGP